MVDKEKDISEKKVQEKLFTIQQLREESETVQKKIIEVEMARSELDKTIESLEYFDKLDGTSEALMNLGGGVFAYVDIKESKKMLVDVGAGVIVEKEVKDAIESLKNRKESMSKMITNLENLLDQIVNRAEGIQRELAELAGEE